MAQLTVIGLGPGDPGLLTQAAADRLNSLETLYLRTQAHPVVAALRARLRLHAFDEPYEQSQEPSQLCERIATELVERAAGGEHVHYAVPGHPLVAEATTRRALQLAAERDLAVEIIDGLSFIEPVCSALKLDPLAHGLQLIDVIELLPPPAPAAQGDDRAWVELQGKGTYQPPISPYPLQPTRPALLCQLAGQHLAGAVRSLLERYPANHPVKLVSGAGLGLQPEVRSLTLEQLDREDYVTWPTVIYLPPLPVHEDRRAIEGIQWIVQHLVGPFGCPWDREQTHLSLRPYLLEEAHETLEALDAGDDDALSEELGDLLLQILLHAELARQEGRFDLGTVTSQIAAKLIRRHPHVFGELAVSGTQEVLRNWEAIKAAERKAKGKQRKGLLDGIPPSLPALALAQKLNEKAAKTGFDWPAIDGVWAKLHEEIEELRSAPLEKRAGEVGDLLFVIANLARWMEIDAESALRATTAKFRRRFAYIEQQAAAQDRKLSDLPREEMENLWNEAKRQE